MSTRCPTSRQGGCNPRPRARSLPASMSVSCFNSAMWIATSSHRDYTNATHDDEEAEKLAGARAVALKAVVAGDD
ncbi:hypothetical protein DFAR_2870048 [Desulfarculales bacterium]